MGRLQGASSARREHGQQGVQELKPNARENPFSGAKLARLVLSLMLMVTLGLPQQAIVAMGGEGDDDPRQTGPYLSKQVVRDGTLTLTQEALWFDDGHNKADLCLQVQGVQSLKEQSATAFADENESAEIEADGSSGVGPGDSIDAKSETIDEAGFEDGANAAADAVQGAGQSKADEPTFTAGDLEVSTILSSEFALDGERLDSYLEGYAYETDWVLIDDFGKVTATDDASNPNARLRITYTVNLDAAQDDSLGFSLPLVLKSEYTQPSEEDVFYAVNVDKANGADEREFKATALTYGIYGNEQAFSLAAPAVYLAVPALAVEDGASGSAVDEAGLENASSEIAPLALNTYVASFDMQGHGTQVPSQVIAYGTLVAEPATPAAKGYIFEGWYTDDAFTTLWNFSADTATAASGINSITLYAKWDLAIYDIAYALNGGVFDDGSGNEIDNPNPTKYCILGAVDTDSSGDVVCDADGNPQITEGAIALVNPVSVRPSDGAGFLGWTGSGISGSAPVASAEIPAGSTGSRYYTANWQTENDWSIDHLYIDQMFSGSAPFDNDQGAGKDTTASDTIVRSFDSVVYRSTYALNPDNAQSFGGRGMLWFEATLPVGEEDAVWDVEAIAWLLDPQVSTDQNGHQVLKGYFVIDGTNASDPLAPRVGALNWTMKVRAMTQGETVGFPEIKMWRDGYENDVAYAEDKVAGGSTLTVSSAPSYNARLVSAGENIYSVVLSLYSDYIPKLDEHGNPVDDGNGNPIQFSKGMKGQELPDESTPITVNVKTNWKQTLADYKMNTTSVAGANGILAASAYADYAPWDYGNAASSHETTFNTVYNGGTVSGTGTAPDVASPYESYITFTVSDFQIDVDNIGVASANHSAVSTSPYQSASFGNRMYNFSSFVFSVTAPSDYPKMSIVNGEAVITSLEAKSVNGTSVGDGNPEDNTVTTILYKPKDTDPGEGYYTRNNTRGDGLFQQIWDPGTKNWKWIEYDKNNIEPPFYNVYPGDAFMFCTKDVWYVSDGGSFGIENAVQRVVVTQKFDDEMFELYENPENTKVPFAYDQLGDLPITFKYITKAGGWASDTDMLNSHLTKDGQPNDGLNLHDTMEAAQASGEPIVGFVGYIDYPASFTQVHLARQPEYGGVVYIEWPAVQVRQDAGIRGGSLITDKSDSRLVGTTVSDGVIWTKNLNDPSEPEQWVSRSTGTHSSGDDDGYLTWAVRNDVNWTDDYSVDYTKAQFDQAGNPDGQTPYTGILVQGASDHNPTDAGVSYYLQTYNVYANKQVAQTVSTGSATETKRNYNLDAGQTRADYRIDSGITGSTQSQTTETITIADNLPKGLHPIDESITGTSTADIEQKYGIAYGGVYDQSMAGTFSYGDPGFDGGAEGQWIDSGGDAVVTDMEDSQAWQAMVSGAAWMSAAEKAAMGYSITETENGDGTTTLTWVLTGVPTGYAFPVIHYSAHIGSQADHYVDVAQGQSLENEVTISNSDDTLSQNTAATIVPVKQGSSTLHKTAVNSVRTATDDAVGFDISFTNSIAPDDQTDHRFAMVDVFPGPGNASGSTDPGNYTIDATFEGTNPATNGITAAFNFNYAILGDSGATWASVNAHTNPSIQTGSGNEPYDFPVSDGWQSLPVSFDPDGSVSAASKQAISDALDGKQVIAIGYSGENLSMGAHFTFGYQYDWADPQEKLQMQEFGVFTNTASQFFSSINETIESTDRSDPLEWKHATAYLDEACTATTPSEIGLAPGQYIKYTVFYRNELGVGAPGSPSGTVTIADAIPDNTSYVPGSASVGYKAGSSSDELGTTVVAEPSSANGGQVVWTIDDVPAGEIGYVTFVVRADDDSFGEVIDNVAHISELATVGGTPTEKAFDTNMTSNPVSSYKDVETFDPETYAVNGTATGGNGSLVQDDHVIRYTATFMNTAYRVGGTDTLSAGTFDIEDVIDPQLEYMNGSSKMAIDTMDSLDSAVPAAVADPSASPANNGTKLSWKTDSIPAPVQNNDGSVTYSAVKLTFDCKVKQGTFDFNDSRTFNVDNQEADQSDPNWVPLGAKASFIPEGETNPVLEYATGTTRNPLISTDVKTSDPVSGTVVEAGSEIEYTVNYKNTTGADTEVTIIDPVPVHTAYKSGTANTLNGVVGELVSNYSAPGKWYDGRDCVVWKSVPVAENAEVDAIFTVRVDGDAQGEVVENTAHIAPANAPDYDTNTTHHPVDPKVASPVTDTAVEAGSEIVYTLTYKNTSAAPVDVTITDDVPEHTTFVSATDDPASAPAVGSTGQLRWEKAAVPADSSVSVAFTVKVDADASGEVVENTAHIAPSNAPDYNTNTTHHPVYPGIKTSDPITGTTVQVGEQIQYYVSYKNVMGSPTTATIVDPLLQHSSYVDGSANEANGVAGQLVLAYSAPGKWYDGMDCVVWENIPLANDERVTVDFKVVVDSDAAGETIENTAHILPGNLADFDTNTTKHPVGEPKLDVSKSVDKGTAQPGDLLTYTIRVKNVGPVVINDTMVRDYIPEHTSFVSAESNGYYGYVNGKNHVTWIIDTLAPEEEVLLRFVVKIDDDVPLPAKILNTALYEPSKPGDPNDPHDPGIPSNPVETIVPKPLAPRTGDDILWATVLGIGLMAAAMFIHAARKKKTKTNTNS